MLIPRFSLRWLLMLIAVFAVFSLVLAGAVHGRLWAAAFCIAVGSLGLVAVLHGLFFLVAWFVSQVLGFATPPEAGSPFATAKPPPQMVQPVEPD